MLDFIFERKCIFKIANTAGVELEELEFELIDFGADDVFLDEEHDQINIYGEFTAYGAIQKFLEEKGLELLHADFERIPTDTKKLSETEAADLDKLLEKLDEDDDVQNVYHNMVIE
jgi:transcriptional/translational regulatory protein YebC/TACO1